MEETTELRKEVLWSLECLAERNIVVLHNDGCDVGKIGRRDWGWLLATIEEASSRQCRTPRACYSCSTLGDLGP